MKSEKSKSKSMKSEKSKSMKSKSKSKSKKSKSKRMKSEKSKSKKSKSKSKSKKSKSRTVELNTAMGRLQALSGPVLLDLPADRDSQLCKLDILASSNFNEDRTEQVRPPLRPPLDLFIEEEKLDTQIQFGESTSGGVLSRMKE